MHSGGIEISNEKWLTRAQEGQQYDDQIVSVTTGIANGS